ncbi:hypothetical protein GPECTOR_15g520 [Gonium pectorale]|uniref:Uncharacterized protein n=1 Tax=Gonium pectorale TaxID=33097 RepID=A0A150GM04_GONPE|nr:hypothetical protein GPECTOR_15g520 [Gonium pectorale]|eukprot:KXZ50834.1 hypothetical protein GPECTOR_15g520 [Gonium pectorale]
MLLGIILFNDTASGVTSSLVFVYCARFLMGRSILSAFRLDASGWRSGSVAFPSLVYEFGVLSGAVYKARQAYSTDASASVVALPAGATTVYVCVRSANIKDSGRAVVPIGPKACSTCVVQISAQVTKEAVADQISALKESAYKSSSVTTSSALGAVQKLAAVATVTNATDSSNAQTVMELASDLLTQLVNASSEVNDTASMVAVFDGVGTLWSMANASSRAAVVDGVSALSAKLASQSLTPEDAQPVMALFSQMLDSAVEIASTQGASTSAGSATSQRKEAARSLLASMTQATASLTRGLLNAAPNNGSTVHLVTARLSAAVQRATAALASAGLTLAVNTPPGSGAATGRRLLAVSASPASISLNPTVGSLCAADAICAVDGIGLTLTATADTSLLAMALDGSFAPLAAAQPDFVAGSVVQVISPIVRVAAPGLPSAALGLSTLIILDLPVDVTMVNSSAKRVVVRLQDVGAAPADAGSGIVAAASSTRTRASASAADTVSAIQAVSDSLGDFVVVQYTTGIAEPNSGSVPGAAGLARPSALLSAILVGAATLAVTLLA